MKHIRKIVYYILLSYLCIAVVFLGFRLILRLLGANPLSPFSVFTYAITDLMLLPFVKIFDSEPLSDRAVFDTIAFIGMIVYVILIPTLMILTKLFTKTVKQVNELQEETSNVEK